MLFPGKKLVYFVRHGQSANNAANIRQGSTGGLSDKGKQQAAFVGERLKDTSIDILLVSPYDRTKETAGIINESLKRPTELSDLLVERKNPSEIVGKDADSDEVRKIMDIIDRSFHESDMRYSDEENFADLKGRAKNLLDMLSKRKEKRIVCVSHRIFLKMVLSYIEQGDALDSHEFAVLDYNTKVENTAVSVCEYSWWRKIKGQNPWKVLAVNDYGRIAPPEEK
jgi:probable phosphoglycerate mutase